MIRHAGRALALFAVGALFAGSAWAQTAPTLAQTVTARYLVAEELLGSAEGTVVKLGSAGGTTGAARPAVRLTVPDSRQRQGEEQVGKSGSRVKPGATPRQGNTTLQVVRHFMVPQLRQSLPDLPRQGALHGRVEA